ncbi:MAG: metallophosphatase family protein [Bacteroidales bacterium OttesenSCG-928-I14]|jgi:putative phosphoesterase|nr:metallophosphatase family protein [Bacteroidales bacterium OttesenSCG-928-I14]
MKIVGVLSDTHACWDNKFIFYFSNCDEIWHAGDIGSELVLSRLQQFKTIRAVYGNIDGYVLKIICPKILRFRIENVNVLLTHIGGYPGNYDFKIRNELYKNTPDIFVCGHSHILKIVYDEKLGVLCLNPGASGKYGVHKMRTLLRFVINGNQINNIEIIELN